MKRSKKIAWAGIGLFIGASMLSSCTASFCSINDKAHMLYVLDYGVTAYYDAEYAANNPEANLTKLDGFNNIYYDVSFDNCPTLKTVIFNAKDTSGLVIPSLDYYKKLDELVLNRAIELSAIENNWTADDIKNLTIEQITGDRGVLDTYGYLKFADSDIEDSPRGRETLWDNWDKLNEQIRKSSDVTIYDCPTNDFVNFYKREMNNNITAYRSCIATKDGYYGYYGKVDGTFTGEIEIEGKSWGYAWNKGFLEGLLIYPIGWLIDTMTLGMLNSGVPSGVAQILGILFITIIVRAIMILFTFKSTAANAKLNNLQPEIAKIQAKYPNANKSQNEKMRMGDEMNKLYKKHGVNPFSSLLTMLIQFPIFICVWGALSGSALLSTGNFLGLNLSESISSVLFRASSWTAAGGYAGITALVLFLLMAGSQVVSMLLPQWMQKAKQKKISRLGRNPAKKSQDNKMKWFTYIMMIMIIAMGFSLASGMGVYWFIGAIVSVGQTLITQKVMESKKKGKK